MFASAVFQLDRLGSNDTTFECVAGRTDRGSSGRIHLLVQSCDVLCGVANTSYLTDKEWREEQSDPEFVASIVPAEHRSPDRLLATRRVWGDESTDSTWIQCTSLPLDATARSLHDVSTYAAVPNSLYARYQLIDSYLDSLDLVSIQVTLEISLHSSTIHARVHDAVEIAAIQLSEFDHILLDQLESVDAVTGQVWAELGLRLSTQIRQAISRLEILNDQIYDCIWVVSDAYSEQRIADLLNEETGFPRMVALPRVESEDRTKGMLFAPDTTQFLIKRLSRNSDNNLIRALARSHAVTQIKTLGMVGSVCGVIALIAAVTFGGLRSAELDHSNQMVEQQIQRAEQINRQLGALASQNSNEGVENGALVSFQGDDHYQILLDRVLRNTPVGIELNEVELVMQAARISGQTVHPALVEDLRHTLSDGTNSAYEMPTFQLQDNVLQFELRGTLQ